MSNYAITAYEVDTFLLADSCALLDFSIEQGRCEIELCGEEAQDAGDGSDDEDDCIDADVDCFGPRFLVQIDTIAGRNSMVAFSERDRSFLSVPEAISYAYRRLGLEPPEPPPSQFEFTTEGRATAALRQLGNTNRSLPLRSQATYNLERSDEASNARYDWKKDAHMAGKSSILAAPSYHVTSGPHRATARRSQALSPSSAAIERSTGFQGVHQTDPGQRPTGPPAPSQCWYDPYQGPYLAMPVRTLEPAPAASLLPVYVFGGTTACLLLAFWACVFCGRREGRPVWEAGSRACESRCPYMCVWLCCCGRVLAPVRRGGRGDAGGVWAMGGVIGREMDGVDALRMGGGLGAASGARGRFGRGVSRGSGRARGSIDVFAVNPVHGGRV